MPRDQDHETLELRRAQLNAQADAVTDRIGLVAEAIAFAREAVRRAHRTRARSAEIRAAGARARRQRGRAESAETPQVRAGGLPKWRHGRRPGECVTPRRPPVIPSACDAVSEVKP